MESKVKSVARLSAAKLILYAGTGLAGILIARLLGPADYGVVAIVLSITGILGVVSDLNLSSAAVKFGSEEGAKREDYVTTAFLSRVLISLTGLLIFILVAKPVAARYGIPPLFLALVALGYLFQAPMALRAIWNIEGRFRLLSFVEGATGIFYLAVMLALTYFFRLAGVFYAVVIISLFMGASSLLKSRFGKFDEACLKKMLPFGLWATLTGIFIYVVQNFDKWFLGLYIAKEQLGYYALAYKAAYFLMFVPLAVQVVIFPEFSRLSSGGNVQEIRRLLNRTIKSCLAYALMGSVALVVVFHFAVKLFLTKYAAAEPLLPFILAPFVLEAGIGATCNALLGGMNRMNEVAGITLVQAALALTVGRELVRASGVWGAIYALWIIYIVSTALFLWRVDKNAGKA